MKINRENYEPYFIDLMDGNLSADQVDEILDFLRLNPDLADELKGIENIVLKPETDSDFNFNSILKSDFDQPEVFAETCIRSIENDLTASENDEFNTYLEVNKKAAKEYQLFKATRFEPDLTIAYPTKGQLKHSRKLSPIWYAAAASVLLAMVLWFNKPQSEIIIPQKAVVADLTADVPTPKIHLVNSTVAFAKIADVETVNTNIPIESKPEAIDRELAMLKPLKVLNTPKLANTADMLLALVNVPDKNGLNNSDYYPTVPELLANQVNKFDVKNGARKIGQFALERLKDISDDKLSFAVNANGNLQKIEYNSRMLAFTVPFNSETGK